MIVFFFSPATLVALLHLKHVKTVLFKSMMFGFSFETTGSLEMTGCLVEKSF